MKVVLKHPDLAGELETIKWTLTSPDAVRRSSRDHNILLFYAVRLRRWIVAVVRRLNGEGFLVTAYQTDAIKEGETIWRK